jgi:predicted nucleic acid-binding protein
MRKQLENGQILMHPFVAAELALGSLLNRGKTLAFLDLLPQARMAQLSEVRQMVESRSLYSRGIGLIDAHLIASVLITPYTVLWTRDKRLSDTARALGIHANLP